MTQLCSRGAGKCPWIKFPGSPSPEGSCSSQRSSSRENLQAAGRNFGIRSWGLNNSLERAGAVAGTSPGEMEAVVNTLHGKALRIPGGMSVTAPGILPQDLSPTQSQGYSRGFLQMLLPGKKGLFFQNRDKFRIITHTCKTLKLCLH